MLKKFALGRCSYVKSSRNGLVWQRVHIDRIEQALLKEVSCDNTCAAVIMPQGACIVRVSGLAVDVQFASVCIAIACDAMYEVAGGGHFVTDNYSISRNFR